MAGRSALSWGWFLTQYPVRPTHPTISGATIGNFSGMIWAKDLKHAESLAQQRNIGERVEGKCGGNKKRRPFNERTLSEILAQRKLRPKDKLDAIHAACFLSYLLMRSCEMSSTDIVGDCGLLHEVVHCLIGGTPTRKHMREVALWYERGVPGYLPVNS